MQIGEGTFGEVFLVQHQQTFKLYAMKVLSKDKIIEHKCLKRVKLEIEVLMQVKSPYLCSIDYFYHLPFHMFIVMPLLDGGELYKILKEKKSFSEEQTKFFIA